MLLLRRYLVNIAETKTLLLKCDFAVLEEQR